MTMKCSIPDSFSALGGGPANDPVVSVAQAHLILLILIYVANCLFEKAESRLKA